MARNGRPSLFVARPSSTNPRLQAFAPLCPQEWATVALGYVKEVDLISSRRHESLVTKGKEDHGAGPKKPDDNNSWKKKPRYPKKGKANEESAA